MERSVNRKKAEISDLLKEYKELINLHSDKVSEYLKNEYYFSELEETLNDKDENDFKNLKISHYNLGLGLRQFFIEYDINHKLIRESTVDMFVKKKPFTYYILKEKPNDLKEDQSNNDLEETPTINNLEE